MTVARQGQSLDPTCALEESHLIKANDIMLDQEIGYATSHTIQQ